MKKIISLLLALVMLISLGVPAFAETESPNSYYYAENWNDLVRFFEEDLEDGDRVDIEVGFTGNSYVVYPERKTACISADDVVIVFENNEFLYNYGGLRLDDTYFKIDGDGVTIDFNNSWIQSWEGSAIEVNGNDCTIKNAFFYNCINRNGYGAGIYITNYDPGCKIINCRFDQCKAKQGGGIYIDSDDATIEGCDFNYCESYEKIGADIYDNEGESIAVNCRTTNKENDNSFANLEKIENCKFEKIGFASTFSEGNTMIIAGVAVVMIAAAAVVFFVLKKKKKKAAAAAETAEEAAET